MVLHTTHRWRFCKAAGRVPALLVILMIALSAVSASAQVRERLRSRIEAAGMPPELTVHGEMVFASVALPMFYERRGHRPAWVDDSGPLPLVDQLIAAIDAAGAEGLRPSDYHLRGIVETVSDIRNQGRNSGDTKTGRLVDLELLCTDAFLIYGSHLLSGRVNPQIIDAEWFANRREADLAAVLETAVNEKTIRATLASLLPPQKGYVRLRRALETYRGYESRGGWALVPDGPSLRKGDSDPRVEALRKRLAITGDLETVPFDTVESFDEGLRLAVVRFQQRHGLDADGVVGTATLAELNVPASDRVEQIAVNLERWRWLPQELGDKHILVNIANFELDVFESGKEALTMRVIVGRAYRRTPVFSDRITYMVFSPYWDVPPSLVVKDILPALRKDPGYLRDNEYEVLKGWGAEMQRVDADTVDWNRVTSRNLGYRFRQLPGSKNALGRIKFMFPNQFNVYLHDTPARGLFARAKRDFSSGCIRIEKPAELAAYLLRDDPRWKMENIVAALDRGVEQTVLVPVPMPIHILYWTAWVSADGTVSFRRDIYERDRPLAEALVEEPPGLK